MTVVAGTLTPNGVLIASDCRTTWQLDGKPMFVDDALKVRPLGKASAIGYAGDARAVRDILEALHDQQSKRQHLDIISLSNWLPRFLKRAYSSVRKRYAAGEVAFLVGGTVAGRLAEATWDSVNDMAARADALGLTNLLAAHALPHLPHTDEVLVRPDGSITILQVVKAKAGRVYPVDDSTGGLLLSLKSPMFSPELCPMPGVLAIGDGAQAVSVLTTCLAHMACGTRTQTRRVFFDAMLNHLGDTASPGVGGALVAVHAANGRTGLMGFQQKDQSGGVVFEVRVEDQRVVVYGRDGRRVVLRTPSEFVTTPPVRPLVFDEIRHMERTALPRRISEAPNVSEGPFRLTKEERASVLRSLKTISEALGEVPGRPQSDAGRAVDEIYLLMVGLRRLSELKPGE